MNLLEIRKMYLHFCYGQVVTQGQFLSGIKLIWIQSFPRLVPYPGLNNLVCLTIYP